MNIYQQANLSLLSTDIDTWWRCLHTTLCKGGIKGNLSHNLSTLRVMYISNGFSVVFIHFICTVPQTLNTIPTSYLQICIWACVLGVWYASSVSVMAYALPLVYNKWHLLQINLVQFIVNISIKCSSAVLCFFNRTLCNTLLYLREVLLI